VPNEDTGTSLVEWLAATGALLPVLVGLITLLVTFWRRPSLSLHVRQEQSRVERSPSKALLPFLRVVARNGRLHRASHGTRVLLEYAESVDGERISLGSPPLGWTSAADSVDVSVVIFPGGERPFDVGRFDSYLSTEEDGSHSDEWCLTLVPYMQIFESRQNLRSKDGGYLLRLVIGSDDGRARRYNLRVHWDPAKRLVDNEWNARELLDSVICKLERVR
jgi:hypothetical protein